MTTHAEARTLAGEAVRAQFDRGPLGGEAQGLAGVSWLETNYGAGWKGAGKGSRNQGAIQCGAGWAGKRFSYVDTHPNADGTSTTYRVDFRAYATDAEAWRDLCRVVYVNRGRVVVRGAAIDRDWFGVSKGLHTTGYYEGFGKTVADRINNHYRSLTRAIALGDGATRLPVLPISEMPPVLRFGATGEAVKLLQRELRIAADGIFGRITGDALASYQITHGLDADRVCGPKTWDVLLHDDYVPEAA